MGAFLRTIHCFIEEIIVFLSGKIFSKSFTHLYSSYLCLCFISNTCPLLCTSIGRGGKSIGYSNDFSVGLFFDVIVYALCSNTNVG